MISQGALVFADISGYTQFSRMHVTSLLHAEAIISELLEAVVHAAEFPLKVTQLEGDAVLLVAETPRGRETEAARDVAWQMQRLFIAFNTHARALITCDAGCVCEACRSIGELKLKAVVHFGVYSLLKVGNVEELAGDAVRQVRALIKTPVPEREYILLTPQFFTLSGGLPFFLPDRAIALNEGEESAQIYFPHPHLPIPALPSGAGRAFAARLNQHSFARMLGRKPRPVFETRTIASWTDGWVHVVPYLFEGISSGLNVLRKVVHNLVMRPAPIQVQRAVVVLIELHAPSSTLSPALETLRADLFNALLADIAPMRLNKLGGGVALLYAVVDEADEQVERAVLGRLFDLYRNFRAQIQALVDDPLSSPALREGASLTFRGLAHAGPVAIKQVLQFEEIAGEAVILIHRLLKNSVSMPEYLLLTESLAERLADEIDFSTRQVEVTEGMGEVTVRVVGLHPGAGEKGNDLETVENCP